jgi:hypothetical protein
LGAGIWEFGESLEYYREEINSLDELETGEPFRVKTGRAPWVGEIVVELLQPIEGTSVFSRFIETNGEGLHHVGFWVLNWDEIMEKLQEQGGKIIAGGFWKEKENARWAYVYTKPGGLILELLDKSAIVKA